MFSHSMPKWQLVLWCLLILLLVNGCSRMSAAPAVEPPSPPGAESSGTKYTTSTRTGSEEFGLSKQELVEYIEQIEGLIAQCMREAGFEYVAVDYNTVRRGMTADKSLPGYSEEQFMREFGFGIATLYDGKPPQLATMATAAKIGLGEQNARLFAALSPADQVAYTRTLFGEYPQATLAVALEAENFALTGGCTKQAIAQLFTPDEISATYMNPFDLQRQQDPQMASRYKQFADCMHAQGLPYTLEQEIEPDLHKRLLAITKNEPVEALSGDAKSALEKLRQEEVAIAAVLMGCGEP